MDLKRKWCRFAFPTPLFEVAGMYDMKPLIKKKNKIQAALPLCHSSKCGSKRKLRKEVAGDERMWVWTHTDSGTATGQTGHNHNSARYCSDPQGKHASENVSGVKKMKQPCKNREVVNNMEGELPVPQAIGKPGVKSSHCLRKLSYLTCIY